MSNLVQLIYISRSNLPATDKTEFIQPEVSQILSKSRRNNRTKQIVGALYFGNNFFFQCLEGEQKKILELYEVLKTDSRHSDLRIVSIKPIIQRSFGEWEMKYVPAENDVQKLLNSFGMTAFDPYLFDESMNNKMLQLLLGGSNLKDNVESSIQTAPSQNQSFNFWKLATFILLALLALDLFQKFL
jgi:hypothetical protein